MNAVPMSPRRPQAILAATVGAVLGSAMVGAPALAHTGLPTGGLADGVLHPLRGVDHLLAMVAVGVVATAARNRRLAVLTPLAFLAGMLGGGGLGLAGLDVPNREVLIAASVVVLGAAVAATATRRAGSWLPTIAASIGALHGLAHGAERPMGSSAWLYVAGFVAVTAGLHVIGALVGLAIRRTDLLRVTAGATVTAVGVSLLVA